MHVVCLSSPRESLALCQMQFSCHVHVDHRVVWHVTLALRSSLCALFSSSFHDFRQCVVNFWPRGCIWNRLTFGSLRVGMYVFVTFSLGVSVSVDLCLSSAFFFSVW